MAISSISSGRSSNRTSILEKRNESGNAFLTRINSYYSNRFYATEGTYKSKHDYRNNGKVNVKLSREFLNENGSSEDAQKQLLKKLRNMNDAQTALTEKLKDGGKKLKSCVFSVDDKGNITCNAIGRSGDSETSFKMKLGNVADSHVDMVDRISKEFDRHAFRLLYTTA